MTRVTKRALTVRGLSVSYGGVHALDGVDLDVSAGEIVGLIGANGAGKTTFIDALTGFTRSRGRVTLGARDITRARPHRRAHLGLTRTFQANELFHDLSVVENVHVAMCRPGLGRAVRSVLNGRPVPEEGSRLALGLLGIEHLADLMPDELSHGQRKLVSIARAATTRPSVLCLDEPAAGLDSAETAQLGEQLRTIAGSGLAIILVDHDMDLVLEVSDTVSVLDFGRVIARGEPSSVRANPIVHGAYLGAADHDQPDVQAFGDVSLDAS